MKVRSSVKPICLKCRLIRRHGRLRNICADRRHNSVQPGKARK